MCGMPQVRWQDKRGTARGIISYSGMDMGRAVYVEPAMYGLCMCELYAMNHEH